MLLKLENIKKEYKISKSNKQIILNDINLEFYRKQQRQAAT